MNRYNNNLHFLFWITTTFYLTLLKTIYMPIYITIPEEIKADKLINEFINEYCGSLVEHLLDSDENGGSRLRSELNTLIISAYHRGMKSTDK